MSQRIEQSAGKKTGRIAQNTFQRSHSLETLCKLRMIGKL